MLEYKRYEQNTAAYNRTDWRLDSIYNALWNYVDLKAASKDNLQACEILSDFERALNAAGVPSGAAMCALNVSQYGLSYEGNKQKMHKRLKIIAHAMETALNE